MKAPILTLFLLFAYAFPSFAQTDSAILSSITGKLEKLNIKHPVEKVYLHLNKPAYNVGDTIWFKGYILVGGHHQPSALSGVLYVELINGENKMIQTLKVRIIGGMATNNIVLGGDVLPGDYRIRAYTNWMRNDSSDYFFLKNIHVSDDDNIAGKVRAKLKDTHALARPQTSISTKQDVDVQFFPEGGQLLTGVRSKVAFKAVGVNGLGIDVSGTVTDNENNDVAFFKTSHAGIGVFAFTPERGKTYTAKINANGNYSAQTIVLPTAREEGFVLSANNADTSNITIRVATNSSTLKQLLGSTFYLIGQSGGEVYFTSAGKWNAETFTASIPKSQFPTGITQFTLFDQNNQPVNERIAFVQNKTGLLKLKLGSDKNSYKPGERISLDIEKQSERDRQKTGNFSLTVYKENDIEGDGQNILTYLLLTSELKGFIENPAYYFDEPSAETAADLDLLMLTQGYRRFVWKDILNDRIAPITFQPEKSLTISGTVTDKGKPVVNGEVSILSVANKLSVNTTTNSQGRFIADSLEFNGTTHLLTQAKKADGNKDVIITLDKFTAPTIPESNLFATAIAQGQLPSGSVTTASSDSFKNTKTVLKRESIADKRTVLKEVNIKARRNAGTPNAPWVPVVVHSDNLNGPGNADIIVGNKEVENCLDLPGCLVAKIWGLSKNGDDFHLSPRTRGKVKFVVDGRMLSDDHAADQLAGISVNSIMSIEVLRSNGLLAIYGSDGLGGIVIITTKKGNEGSEVDEKPIPGLANFEFMGYAPQRQFYLPKYMPANTSQFDQRTAVCWNPQIIVNSKDATTIELFNYGLKGHYIAVIEGIDEDGNAGRGVYKYTVQ